MAESRHQHGGSELRGVSNLTIGDVVASPIQLTSAPQWPSARRMRGELVKP